VFLRNLLSLFAKIKAIPNRYKIIEYVNAISKAEYFIKILIASRYFASIVCELYSIKKATKSVNSTKI